MRLRLAQYLLLSKAISYLIAAAESVDQPDLAESRDLRLLLHRIDAHILILQSKQLL